MRPVSFSNVAAVPSIRGDEDFDTLADRLAKHLLKIIRQPCPFEDIRSVYGKSLESLSAYIKDRVDNVSILAILMCLRGQFASTDEEAITGINETRALVCEWIAIRYIARFTDKELINCLLTDPPWLSKDAHNSEGSHEQRSPESSPLLGRGSTTNSTATLPAKQATMNKHVSSGLYAQVQGLNTLEIAAVSEAKKFLASKPIQRIVTAIWDGDIVFWSNFSPDAKKCAEIYHEQSSDVYSRLRVPKYLKAFEFMFFAAFLVLYYLVLGQKSFDRITTPEIFLYIWLASFSYNELAEFWDAGLAFYFSDFWALWDIGIIITGAAFLVCRVIGLSRHDVAIVDVSFDLLALEALFLVPRIFSLLSLHPYFGTLLPCLRDMTKDFIKFLSVVVILYFGFLTTFTLLGRDRFTFKQMSWILVKVFFGSSYLGFDVAEQISPILGPPLMLIFVALTNILLITSLISILSNSLTKVIEHAADEYRFVYSVFVLEASTSDRLTYFLPPLNLVPLLLRPCRLFLSTGQLRMVRVALLKITHAPHVALIRAYELVRRYIDKRRRGGIGLPTAAPEALTPRQRRLRVKRLSALEPLGMDAARRDTMSREGDGGWGSGDQQGNDAVEAIKALEAAVGRLTRQVEQLQAGRDVLSS